MKNGRDPIGGLHQLDRKIRRHGLNLRSTRGPECVRRRFDPLPVPRFRPFSSKRHNYGEEKAPGFILVECLESCFGETGSCEDVE